MVAKRESGRSRQAASEPADSPVPGAVSAAVSAYIESLDLGDDLLLAALAEIARANALQLDGDAGMATAAVSKELRATLHELDGDDVGDDDAFATWESQLGQPS